MTATSSAAVCDGSKSGANLDFEIQVFVDDVPSGGTELSGLVQMNVLRKIAVYGVAVTVAPSNSARILKGTGEGGEKGNKKSSSGAASSKRFWSVRDTFKYLPFENSSIILVGSKVADIMEWIFDPMKPREHHVCHYQPGLYDLPFSFDLTQFEVLVGNYEYKGDRGHAAIENKLYVTVAPATQSVGQNLITFPRKISIPNFLKLDSSLKAPTETNCCLKKGNQDMIKFVMTLNQQAYVFGEEIEFKVEKWQKPNTNFVVREMGVTLVRKITVLVPKMQINIFGVYQETKYKQKLLLDKIILASKSTYSKGPSWTDSIRFPDGIIDTTDMTVEVSYGMELTVNVIGSAQPLRAFINFLSGSQWDEGPVGSLSKNPWFCAFPRGSLTSLNFDDLDSECVTASAYPPNYSALSARTPSVETLPPSYNDAVASTTKNLSALDVSHEDEDEEED